MTAWLMAAVVMIAACSSPMKPSQAAGPGPASAQPVPGAFGPGVFINSVASDPWTAVGSSAGPDGQPETACFLSADARTWHACGLVPDDTDGRRTRLLGVARLGSTLIAGGVAVGALHGNPRPYLWSGSIGGPLNELNLPRELFGGERIISFNGLTTGPLGGFAVGTWDGVTNQTVAQVWRTTDGTDWHRLDGVSALTGSPEEILEGRAVAVGARRVVLVGTAVDLLRLADRDDGAMWWSDDGTTWTRADLTGAQMGGAGDQELRAVASSGISGGFVAGGSDGPAAVVWSSIDGRTWRRADPLPHGQGTGARVTAVVAGGSGTEWAAGVVAGSPRLWSSSDPAGRRWSDRPLPTADLATGPAQSVTLAAGSGLLLVVVQGSQGSAAAIVGGA